MSGAEFSFGVKAASFNVLFGDDISFLGRTSLFKAHRDTSQYNIFIAGRRL